MHRRPLIKLLEEYRLKWAAEREACDRFLEFVERCPECFERSLEEGHVTGSAWLVNSLGSHVLLTHHRKLGKWFQLGGHADGVSDVASVALREAREESGLNGVALLNHSIYDLDIHSIPERRGEPEHLHYDVRFAVRVTGSEQFSVSEESLDLAWVEIARLEEFTEEASMLRMARKWKRSLEAGEGLT